MNIKEEIELALKEYEKEFSCFPTELPLGWCPDISVKDNMHIDRLLLNRWHVDGMKNNMEN
jgi:hypothetical protein